VSGAFAGTTKVRRYTKRIGCVETHSLRGMAKLTFKLYIFILLSCKNSSGHQTIKYTLADLFLKNLYNHSVDIIMAGFLNPESN